jgi:hypothetical protein
MACFMNDIERSFKVSLGRFRFSGRAEHPMGILVSGGPCSSAVACLYARYLASLPPNPRAPEQKVVLIHVNCGDHRARARFESLAAQLTADRVIVEPPDILTLKDVSDAEIISRRRVVSTAIRAASEVGCSRVLVGTTADRAAVDILSFVISGCGPQVGPGGQDSFTLESMGPDGAPLLVLRPLLHAPVRLAVRYAREAVRNMGAAEHLESSMPASLGGSRNRPGLLGALERFVASAQAENGACVHNVVRTAARLGGSDSSMKCALCGGVVTDQDSTQDPRVCGKGGGASCDASCGWSCSSTPLCYSCEGAVHRAGGCAGGGADILSIAGRDARRRAMQSEIQEFLIEEEPDFDDAT